MGWLFGFIGYTRAQKMYQSLVLANNAGMLPNGLVPCNKYCLYANKLNVIYIVELYNNAMSFGLTPTNELYQQVCKAKSNYIKMWVYLIIGMVLCIFPLFGVVLLSMVEDFGTAVVMLFIIFALCIVALIFSYIGGRYSKKNIQLLEYLLFNCNQYFYPDYQQQLNRPKAVVIPPQSTNNRA